MLACKCVGKEVGASLGYVGSASSAEVPSSHPISVQGA